MMRPRSIALLLGLITLVVFLPAISFQFIHFDDYEYIAANPVVQNGLTVAGLKWAFVGAHAGNWHPLTWLSLMLDCDLFHLNPAGPHFTNILLHAANASLLFALIFRLAGKIFPAFLVAALFAWHPLHVESVAWVAERKDVLSTFFTFLALLAYTFYVQENNRRQFWLAWLYYILALLAKPMPVTLPLVLLLLDYWPLRRLKWAAAGDDQSSHAPSPWPAAGRLIWEKWPFFLSAAVLCLITLWAQRSATSSLTTVPFLFRLENAMVAYGLYLWKMIWPLHLAIFYPLQDSITVLQLTGSLVLLIGISILVWCWRQARPWFIVGWLWFLVTLLPVIGLVQVGGQSMADRYSYFPSIGIFLALAVGIQTFMERSAWSKRWLTSAVILVLGACISLTEVQLSYWHDSITLFQHSLRVADSALAHVCLGRALDGQKKTAEAVDQYLLALNLDPKFDIACQYLAKALADEGKLDQAVDYYRKTIELKPKAPAYVYDDFGIVLIQLKHPDEALQQFSTATQLDPADYQPHFYLGRLQLQLGQDTNAVAQLRQAVQLNPDDPQLLIYTITVLSADENPAGRDGKEALKLARHLVQLTGDQQPAALDALGMSYAETGDYATAALMQTQAIQLAPAGNQMDDLAGMQQRLQLYQKHQPWRESFRQ